MHKALATNMFNSRNNIPLRLGQKEQRETNPQTHRQSCNILKTPLEEQELKDKKRIKNPVRLRDCLIFSMLNGPLRCCLKDISATEHVTRGGTGLFLPSESQHLPLPTIIVGSPSHGAFRVSFNCMSY